MKVRPYGDGFAIFCPACDTLHGFNCSWGFNHDMERPTVRDSLGSNGANGYCHIQLAGGVITYYQDSAHALAGKSMLLPDLPEWALPE